MRAVGFILLLCMLVIAGCVTDELLVFEKGVLSRDEMKPLLGKYTWTERANYEGESSKVQNGELIWEERGPRYHFSMAGDLESQRVEYEGFTVVSEIPDSKSGLLILAIPKCSWRRSDNGEKDSTPNVFLIVMSDKDKLYAWLLGDGAPVAKGQISCLNPGEFKASEVKTFLEEYADAYVLANEPMFTFKKN